MSVLQGKIRAKLTGWASAFVSIPVPQVFSGAGCLDQMGNLCKDTLKVKKVMIVTDEIVPTLGLIDSTIKALTTSNVNYVVFDRVTPDPTVETCVAGVKVYIAEKCDAIIAFGGGSSMDAAKMIAILTMDPKKDPKSFTGMMQLGLFPKLPPLIAVPTTAGTGSETTLAAIVSVPAEKKKYAVMDPHLVPPYAFLDPLLLQKLPKAITAATGMDALTHAVESFVAPWRTQETMDYSLRAVKNIFDFLPKCYHNGENDLYAREKMLIASFDAGLAFTRAGVGYVHAIAHQLGGLFHIPHGVANAMLLHHMLEYYRTPPTNNFALDALAKLCLVVENRGHENVKPGEREELAKRFVDHVRILTHELEIPTYAKGFPESMVSEVASRALNEAHGQSYKFSEDFLKAALDGGYPVPKYMDLEQCKAIAAKVVDPAVSKL